MMSLLKFLVLMLSRYKGCQSSRQQCAASGLAAVALREFGNGLRKAGEQAWIPRDARSRGVQFG